MSVVSWGRYPKIDSQAFYFQSTDALRDIIDKHNGLIAYGNGRSYGDSALSDHIIKSRRHRYFLDFDEKSGLLCVQAGVLLSEILNVFVPRGWFLNVTPGTKLITVGGAIASDVHGKNHHHSGCFSEFVSAFNLMLASGEIVTCSKRKNIALFKATCGGMGLTGVIVDVKLRLKKINSTFIDQVTIRTKNLKETFAAFDEQHDKPYSVAWIDCLARGEKLGRSLLMTGAFSDDGNICYKQKRTLSVPFNLPSFLLNKYSVKAFNTLYYHKVRRTLSRQKVDIDTFFYPLDRIANWNRMYGKSGFTQYQFILPKEKSFAGLEEALTLIANSGRGSCLAVLKLYGKANNNYLSFPMEGYSLALDFKIEPGLFALLDRLDDIVLKYEGRIYLAKDVRVKKEVFEQGYPKIDTFRALRKKHAMTDKFNSLQSRRVGL